MGKVIKGWDEGASRSLYTQYECAPCSIAPPSPHIRCTTTVPGGEGHPHGNTGLRKSSLYARSQLPPLLCLYTASLLLHYALAGSASMSPLVGSTPLNPDCMPMLTAILPPIFIHPLTLDYSRMRSYIGIRRTGLPTGDPP